MNGELHVGLDSSDFLARFPLKEDGRVRLVGTVSDEALTRRDRLKWDDINTTVMKWMPLELARVNWFSTYHVHHRVAGRFRKDRAFLLGDAAHIHSPVGGQGMNTGIGDAVNLAWKLAWVLKRRADKSLLDSYEPERIAFARRLVKTTDQAFTAVTSSGAIPRFLRLDIVPALLPLFAAKPMRRFLYRTVSQTDVNYRGSPLSEGHFGSVRGGDRLPWVKTAEVDNYPSLTALDWQVHVYGEATDDLRRLCAVRNLKLQIFPWQAGMHHSGLRRNTAYLVRPDGYVAMAEADGKGGAIAPYLHARQIATRGP
jgi:FAD binding domain